MEKMVKYHNYMNALDFKGFKSSDYDFLMYLCAQMRDHDEDVMSFSMNEIRNVTGFDYHASSAQFSEILEGMNKKLMQVTAKVRDGSKTIMFVLFPTFITDEKTNTLTVRVNPDFKFLLNEITKNFTQFELAEFVELNSKYAKTLYRLLKQYRRTGEYHVKADELRKLLGCPESYPNKYVMRDVIAPAVKELQKDFPTLTVETIRARTKGRPVTGYYFTFEADNGQIPGQMTIDEAAEEVRRYKAKKTREQPKNNKFTDFQQRQEDEDLDAIMMKRTQAKYGKKQ